MKLFTNHLILSKKIEFYRDLLLPEVVPDVGCLEELAVPLACRELPEFETVPLDCRELLELLAGLVTERLLLEELLLFTDELLLLPLLLSVAGFSLCTLCERVELSLEFTVCCLLLLFSVAEEDVPLVELLPLDD
jgi:hypothetical protein